jgi:hypothetical protein
MCASGRPSSAQERLVMNHDSRLLAQPPDQHPEIARLKRDASSRRRKARPRHMDEDRAAAPGNSRAGVVIDLDDDVVQAILPPKPVAWFTGRSPKGAIITPVAGVLAPRIGRADGADGKLGQRTRQAVRPPPQSHGAKTPARRPAIAFALIGPDSGTPERDRHAPRPGADKALRRPARPRADIDRIQRNPSHRQCLEGANSQVLLAPVSFNALFRARRRSTIAS